MVIEIFDQRDEETWPDQQKDNDKDNDIDITKTVTKTIPETCDIWDTDYSSDNWEPEFMKIFVTWQLRVTLDNVFWGAGGITIDVPAKFLTQK